MHLCYLDESGEGSPFVLAGFSAFERDAYFLAEELDDLASVLFPDADEPVIFHASEFGAFDKIAHLFDQADGQLHGLVHLTRRRETCMCIACINRRSP